MKYIHKTTVIDDGCKVGEGSKVWHFVHIREGVSIGKECIIGQSVYLDSGVKIGDRVKIGNNCSIYRKCKIGNGVLIGPHVIILNDKTPRAVNPDGSLKGDKDWDIGRVEIGEGASIGAGSIVLPNVKMGSWSMVGAGSLVTKDVPENGLVYGSPTRLRGFVCKCGKTLSVGKSIGEYFFMLCSCGIGTKIKKEVYKSLE